MKKKILGIILVVVLVGVGKFIYDVHFNYNFEKITEGKVYKSGVIPPDQIEAYTKKYNIKSIIDLRRPGTNDLINNPEVPSELLAEKQAVEKIGGVNYYNIISSQVPEQKTLDSFFNVMDDPNNYPVLIHCHHGEGRAPLFGALYRIEYEDMPNDEARKKTRALVKWSPFDKNNDKGKFLIEYNKRDSNN